MDKLRACSQRLAAGDLDVARDSLEQLAKASTNLPQDLHELERIDRAIDQITKAKDGMNCAACSGAGCVSCQGGGAGQAAGTGRGPGAGAGLRPERDSDGTFVDSQVASERRGGPAVLTDETDGPQVPGEARLQVQTAVESFSLRAASPIHEARIPPSHRDHARQYFDALRKE